MKQTVSFLVNEIDYFLTNINILVCKYFQNLLHYLKNCIFLLKCIAFSYDYGNFLKNIPNLKRKEKSVNLIKIYIRLLFNDFKAFCTNFLRVVFFSDFGESDSLFANIC